MINTVSVILEKIKTILHKAQRMGYDVNTDFERFSVKKEDTNAIYLTIDELNCINKLKNLSKEAKAVRDMFLIGCFTAMRFSDYSNLTSDNIVHICCACSPRRMRCYKFVFINSLSNNFCSNCSFI